MASMVAANTTTTATPVFYHSAVATKVATTNVLGCLPSFLSTQTKLLIFIAFMVLLFSRLTAILIMYLLRLRLHSLEKSLQPDVESQSTPSLKVEHIGHPVLQGRSSIDVTSVHDTPNPSYWRISVSSFNSLVAAGVIGSPSQTSSASAVCGHSEYNITPEMPYDDEKDITEAASKHEAECHITEAAMVPHQVWWKALKVAA